MKFKIRTEDLLGKLAKIGAIARTKTTIPICQTILFDIKQDVLTLHVNNSHVYAKTILRVESKEDFGFCIEERAINNTFRLLTDEEIEFEYKDNQVIIRSGRKKLYTVPSFKGSEFPVIIIDQEKLNESHVMVSTKDFIYHLANAAEFPNPNDIRPMFSAVCIRHTDDMLFLIGVGGDTGGVMTAQQMNCSAVNWKDCLVPKQTSLFMCDLLYGINTYMHIINDKLYVKSGEVEMIITMLNGRYPAVKHLLEKPINTYCKIKREEFLSSLKRTSYYSNTTYASILSFNEQELHVTSEDNMSGKKAQEVIDIENYGINFSIAFNSLQLQVIVSQIPSENILIYVSSSKTQCIIRPENIENDKSSYLIMPCVFEKIKQV